MHLHFPYNWFQGGDLGNKDFNASIDSLTKYHLQNIFADEVEKEVAVIANVVSL